MKVSIGYGTPSEGPWFEELVSPFEQSHQSASCSLCKKIYIIASLHHPQMSNTMNTIDMDGTVQVTLYLTKLLLALKRMNVATIKHGIFSLNQTLSILLCPWSFFWRLLVAFLTLQKRYTRVQNEAVIMTISRAM